MHKNGKKKKKKKEEIDRISRNSIKVSNNIVLLSLERSTCRKPAALVSSIVIEL